MTHALYLLLIELLFNVIAYIYFKEYFFYYYYSDLWHFTSFVTLPFWWVGYKLIVKNSNLFYKEEKLNIIIAIMMIVIAFAYQ